MNRVLRNMHVLCVVAFFSAHAMKESSGPKDVYTGEIIHILKGKEYMEEERLSPSALGVWMSEEEIGVSARQPIGSIPEDYYLFRWKSNMMHIMTEDVVCDCRGKIYDVGWKYDSLKSYGNGKGIELFSNSAPGTCLREHAFLVKVDEKRKQTKEWKSLISTDVRLQGDYRWSADGTHLAVQLRDRDEKPFFYVFSVRSATDFSVVGEFSGSVSGLERDVFRQLKFNAKNSFLAGALHERMYLFDLKNRCVLMDLELPGIDIIEWHPTQDMLLVGQKNYPREISPGLYRTKDVALRLIRVSELIKRS